MNERGATPSSGSWEGRVYKLRKFPCLPAEGKAKGVEYAQTMGRISLRFVLTGELAELTANELVVQLSSWELKVETDDRPDLDSKLSPLCGDLYGDVRRDLSWWTIEKEANGDIVFRIDLAKREHKAWNAVWKVGLSHLRRTHFGWTPGTKAPVKKAEEVLVKVKPGRPESLDKERFVINREQLCNGLEDGQDNGSAIYRIHFDRGALQKACESVLLADLFAADVTDRFLKVFIRGDEKSPILLGQLYAPVIPDKTKWEIVKAVAPPEEDEAEPKAQKGAGGQAPQYNTCLQITLAKAKPSSKLWPFILQENEHALQRDAAPVIEDLQAIALREPSPDRSGWTKEDFVKESKTKGDAHFRKSEWRDAAVQYTKAIDNAPEDEKLYSNRSVCYLKMKRYDKALSDANRCCGINPRWPKAYFRQGQALRGLQRWEDAINAFKEGRFMDAANPDWEKEIEKTEDERDKWDAHLREQRRLKREADLVTELNEATLVAEREAMVVVAEQALRAGKSKKEAGELAMKGAELAKQRVHEMANQRKKAMMVEDDKEADEPAPYRIVQEDGTLHSKGFAHTDKGMYFMGMTLMNTEKAPGSQPWIEIRHPRRLRWSQGCALLRLKVTLPSSVKSAAEIEVSVTPTHIRVGTVGDTDPVVEGEFERKVEPNGENFSWYLVPDETPPILEMCIDKAASEVYQTFSYTTLIWPRLFKDDLLLGEGLFEADLTDLPPHLLEQFRREQALANQRSLDERKRRSLMTEEEVAEETARNWNDEFARHDLPHRLDTNEDRVLQNYRA